jgi:hypothetical protein
MFRKYKNRNARFYNENGGSRLLQNNKHHIPEELIMNRINHTLDEESGNKRREKILCVVSIHAVP